MTAAYRFARAGWHTILLEAREQLGGLARSMRLGRAAIERYYHFICGGDAALLALAGELGLKVRWRPAPVGHWYRGRLYPLSTALDLLRFAPLSFADRLRMGLHAWRAQKTTSWQPLDEIPAKRWLLESVGPRVYDVVWRPLLETKFGPYADRVSAAWLWHRLWRVGTSRSSPLRPETMGYIEGGSQALVDALADRITDAGGEIWLGCAAGRVHMRGDGLAVEAARGDVVADVAVLAVPLPVAADLIRAAAPDFASALERVAVMGVVCGLVRMPRHLTQYFWLNINDERISFNGLIEYSNLNHGADAWGGEVVYVPFYLPADDPRFSWSDARWAEVFLGGLRVIDPELAEACDVVAVTRDVHAQPVCDVGFSRRVPPLQTPADRVFLVEASQLYPSDRCLSGMIGLAGKAVELALRAV